MPDDLDELIRGAMKTLDEGVPSGYFESLPNRTLARLEGSMQHGSEGQAGTRGGKVAPPPIASQPEPDTSPVSRQPIMQQEREEDSGLHDIRNLAQSTKQRLSKRSITSPPVPDDDLLAASSGAFKNIALPQPAKMVSLPSVDELPSKAEIAAAEKAAKRAARESAKELKKAEASGAAPSAAIDAPVASASASIPQRQAFTLPSQQRKSSKGPIVAILGLGLAAAAGGVFYMQMDKEKAAAPSMASEQAEAKVAPAPVAAAGSAATVEAVAQPAPVEATPAAAPEPPKDEAAAGAAQLATDSVEQAEAKATDDKTPAKNKKKPPKGKKVDKDEPPKAEEKKGPEKVEIKKPETTSKKGGEAEGEPSFDALLKEAGVSGEQKKDNKPKLDKKSLNRDDFNKGIGASATKAKGCYKGTQGTVMLKLTIAPSGSVSKVTVSGDFAGKPEGTCVENAMKGATFPPWDGGPQSFNYSVLLSD